MLVCIGRMGENGRYEVKAVLGMSDLLGREGTAMSGERGEGEGG